VNRRRIANVTQRLDRAIAMDMSDQRRYRFSAPQSADGIYRVPRI
jgi:hypothetical protein